MSSETDIAWLAGLLEGEGCFSLIQRADNRTPTIQVGLAMTDVDTVERAAAIVSTRVRPQRKRSSRHKRLYKATWTGLPAEEVMRTVLPHMGRRRSERILDCLGAPLLSHHSSTKPCGFCKRVITRKGHALRLKKCPWYCNDACRAKAARERRAAA